MSMVFQTLHGRVPGNYIQQLVCKSDMPVSAPAVDLAFGILVKRHPALRLQFEWEGGEPYQTVAESVTVPIGTQLWEGDEAWKEFLLEDRLQSFDLRHAPLLRVTRFEEAPSKTTFVMTNHHALLDGRSRRIVMRELFTLIQAEQPSEDLLPPAPAPYTEYLQWMASSSHSGSEPFWREYLEQLPTAADLPLPEPAGRSGAPIPGPCIATVSASATASLRTFAAGMGCSLNNVVQAAWAIVLARYSGSEEAVFGTTRACRHSAVDGTASAMVGLLMNTVPIRVRMKHGTTVRQLLAALKRLQLDMRDRENTPLSKIFEAAKLSPGEALFRAYLMFEDNGLAYKEQYPGWSCKLLEQTELLSLSAVVHGQIALTLEYNPTRYSDSSMSRVLTDFTAVLAEIALAPGREIDAIQAFTPSVLATTILAKPAYANVVSALEYWSRVAPASPAVLSEKGSLTYADLERRSNVLANHLIAVGVQAGSTIAVSMDRSEELIIAFFGIWKAGCAYMPIDLRYPEEGRRHMLEDSGAVMVLDKLPDCGGASEISPRLEIPASSAAYLMYTSGSTGKPKGVLISHESLANLCAAMSRVYQLTPADRVLQASTTSFDISVEEIFPSLWAGAAIVPASQAAASSVRDFMEFVARWQCTVLNLPTAFWHLLVLGMKESGCGLPFSVRLTSVGGERVLPAVYATWKSLPDGGRIRWLNTYGPTETTVTATVFEPTQFTAPGNLPIGTPIEGVNTYILDPQLRQLPIEASGELFIGGVGVALGYRNAPDLTATKFIPDPFNPGRRMYRTGDNARLLSDGNIEFLGRKDFQVKFRGYRIELGEIETAAEANPDVSQAIAQVRGGAALVLFVVPRVGHQLRAEALREWLSGKLTEWMVPTAIVSLDKFPVTAGGKLDRAALAALPVGNSERRAADGQPETDLERSLIQIWEELFQKSPISPEDNFFSLGGYSLLAMRMLVRAEKLAGRALGFADLSQSPTIRQFARLIAGETDRHLPECLVILRASGEKPPLFCLHGAGGAVHWYNDFAQRIGDRPVIGIQSSENLERAFPASLEEMCESYLQAIRHFQPQGPYHFIGHSMGGMLAFHCAVLCARRGDQVGFVGTLDGWNRAADNPTAPEKLGRLFRYFWSLDGTEKFEFAREKVQWLRFEGSQRAATKAAGADNSALRDSIRANNIKLARRYVAPYYDGTVHVFRAGKRSAAEDPDPMLGWGKVASHVVAVEVPGNHYTLLSPPNAEVLAEKLMNALCSEAGDRK